MNTILIIVIAVVLLIFFNNYKNNQFIRDLKKKQLKVTYSTNDMKWHAMDIETGLMLKHGFDSPVDVISFYEKIGVHVSY